MGAGEARTSARSRADLADARVPAHLARPGPIVAAEMGQVPLELHSRVAVMCRLVFRTATWTGARFVESCVPGYTVRPAHNCGQIARQHSARRGMKWQQWRRPRVAKNGRRKAEHAMKDAQIYVTQPELPPLNQFIPLLERIWETRVLTNGGPFHEQLERALCEYLGVEHISLFANGTIALMSALQALRISGEVITSPFSFVATAHSIHWNHLTPVFVDIDPATLNLDPARIEEAVTSRTSAIMPVHCYGNPCDVRSIRAISERRGLKVIYDAAHAFGVKREGESVLRHGDLAVLSFHATKVFNTFEGGAIVCHDERLKRRIDSLKNFGFQDEVTVAEPGLNGKMSEFQAALGILQLQTVDQAIAMRKRIDQRYRDGLAAIEGIECVQPPPQVQPNCSYFPILVRPSYRLDRDALHRRLMERGIIARRYFHPLISEFDAYRNLPSAASENLPVATEVARQVLCLPIYPRLGVAESERVIDIIAGG